MLADYLKKEQSIIRRNILDMGDKASTAIQNAITCYTSMNLSLAEEIIKGDTRINELENIVEAECIQIIARQQPVAHDLRVLLADMNIAKELERIADYAVAIAKIVQKMPSEKPDIEHQIVSMADKCIMMLNEVMIDYAEEDAKKANSVALLDDEVDQMEHDLNEKMFKLMESEPEKAIGCTYQLWIIHQLERIGDRVTNIAESVIFLATGKVVNFD